MQITLIGLDALGLSLGLALKAVAPEIQIVCHDRERARIKAATQAGAADKGHWNLLTACDGSDLVIVNEPFGQLETDLTALARELAENVVVLALTASQRPLAALIARLEPRATVIGGRFVARGLTPAAEPAAALLNDALLYVIAAPNVRAEAIQTVTNLAQAVGARPFFIDAAESDGLAAPTAQLPGLLALALLSTLAQSEGHRELERALDPSLSALAAYAPAPEQLTELLSNTDNLPRWLAAYGITLQQLADRLVAGDEAGLQAEITATQTALARWGQPEQAEDEPADTTPAWRQMLLGQRRGKRRA